MCCWLWTLCHTIQHRAVLIIFHLNLQAITITRMLSSGGDGDPWLIIFMFIIIARECGVIVHSVARLCVCLSVCPVPVQNIKIVYQGHRVNVKVTRYTCALFSSGLPSTGRQFCFDLQLCRCQSFILRFVPYNALLGKKRIVIVIIVYL